MAPIQWQYLKVTLQSVDSAQILALSNPSCTPEELLCLFLSVSFALFYLLIPSCLRSLVFSSNSLETLELLMLARKHILLQSEEYLCSVSNTNRRFKYCSSGVCLCKLGKQGEKVWVCICVLSRDWLWETLWACMCLFERERETLCLPRGCFCFLCGVHLKWTIGSDALHPMQRDTTEHQQKADGNFVWNPTSSVWK